MATVPALPDPDGAMRLVRDAADGRPPVADGRVTVLRSGPDDLAGILAFTLHHVVVGDVDEAWVGEHLTPGDMSAPVGLFVAARRTARPHVRQSRSGPRRDRRSGP